MCVLGGTACDAGETPAVHPKEVSDRRVNNKIVKRRNVKRSRNNAVDI
jgi:hypothetical protein